MPFITLVHELSTTVRASGYTQNRGRPYIHNTRVFTPEGLAYEASRLRTEAVQVVSTFPILVAFLAVSFTLAGGGSSRSTSIQTPVLSLCIVTQPQTVTAPAAATLTFVAAGTPPLTYQWRGSEKAITGARSATSPWWISDEGSGLVDAL